GGVEVAAVFKRDPHGFKIAGRSKLNVTMGAGIARAGDSSLDLKRCRATVAAEGKRSAQASRLDSARGRAEVYTRAEESDALSRVLVAGIGQCHGRGHHAARVKAGAHILQSHKAFQEQPGAGEEHYG